MLKSGDGQTEGLSGLYTVYRETLTKGKSDKFDESCPNRQTKNSIFKYLIKHYNVYKICF